LPAAALSASPRFDPLSVGARLEAITKVVGLAALADLSLGGYPEPLDNTDRDAPISGQLM